MKLSDGEKIIAILLTDIHRHLQINGELDVNFINTAIFYDELWSIPLKFSGLAFMEGQELPENVKEVFDILEMWRVVELQYARFDKKDREELQSLVPTLGKNPAFIGFDGNEESDCMQIADCIINRLGRYIDFKNRSLNSHTPVLEGYRRALSTYKEIKPKGVFGKSLEVKELAKILQARVHPENQD